MKLCSLNTRYRVMMSFLLVALLFFPGETQNNFIDWKADRKLTWKDFTARPLTNTDNVALTSSSINFKFGYGSSGFRYSIFCQFDKSRSWGRVKNDYILAHEQGHFDIAEIHARKLKKALSNYKYKESTASIEVNKLYEDIMKQHHEMQNLYDLQTDHSRKSDQQAEWLKKIAAQLKEMEPYADYR